MHTSRQLKNSDFAIRIKGEEVSREELLPNWKCHDRVGIIVDEPFGAVGASLLLQLCITAFYDVLPSRRSETIYPEIYLFHIGGRYGDHSSYDIYPPRKEVFLDNNPAQILEAINDRSITRLIVVDRDCREVKHHFKEPSTARDRIVSVFAYCPTGDVGEGDIEIKSLNRNLLTNTRGALSPGSKAYAESMEKLAKSSRMPAIPDCEIVPDYPSRSLETTARIREKIRLQFDQSIKEGFRRETYRRVSLSDALNMLVKVD